MYQSLCGSPVPLAALSSFEKPFFPKVHRLYSIERPDCPRFFLFVNVLYPVLRMQSSRLTTITTTFCCLLLYTTRYVRAQAQCFFPNSISLTSGNLNGDFPYEWVPCNPHTPESMCCRTNTTTNPDTCRLDGLCESYDKASVWRDSCTDATWLSGYCVKWCISGGGR